MDNLDEYHSPYLYVGNNPIYFIDPDGNGSNPFDLKMPDIGAGGDKAIETASYMYNRLYNHVMGV